MRWFDCELYSRHWARRGFYIALCGKDCGCGGSTVNCILAIGHGVGFIFRCVAKVVDAVVRL